jgi:ubiquinone/menaquinone biosynthesis C-methylase UbiE
MGGEGREFDFVRGIGEALPMRPGLFDWALSAASLDHFPEPRRVLAEVKRVLRPTGRLGLWVGATDPDYFRRMYPSPSLRSQKDRELLWDVVRQGKFRRLARSAWHHSVVNRVRILILRWRHWTDESRLMESIFPKRSAERFRFYTEGEVLGLLLQPGYRVIKQVLITNLEHGNSLFLIAAPL